MGKDSGKEQGPPVLLQRKQVPGGQYPGCSINNQVPGPWRQWLCVIQTALIPSVSLDIRGDKLLRGEA